MGYSVMKDIPALASYTRTHDQALFAEVVRRQVDFVYSSALRQVDGDAHLAADVTQQVFIALARNPGAVAGHTSLEGWLYTTARYTAANAVRRERRRRARELEAHVMNSPDDEASPDEMWAQVRPVLDAAMSDLSANDRESILLRYFVGRPFRDIADQLKISENAARMRVERALERLRAALERRGIRSTAAALGGAIAGNAVVAAPSSLASTIAAAAPIAAGAAAGSAVGIWLLHGGLAAAVALAFSLAYRTEAETAGQLRAELTELQQIPSSRRTVAAAVPPPSREETLRLSQLDEQLLDAAGELETVAQAAARRSQLPPPAPIEDQKDRPPVLRRPVNPVYPRHLWEAGISGNVEVQFIVDVNGKVAAAQSLSSTHPDFEPAALEAIKQWEFIPGWKEPRFVNTRLNQLITFSRSQSADAAPPPAGK
jgi:RNA polymerase sigma factor (sigma-70 family)